MCEFCTKHGEGQKWYLQISQCQFGAQFYSSALRKVYIDPAKCYGCGVCRATCPHDAISLLPRQQDPVAAGIWLSGAAV